MAAAPQDHKPKQPKRSDPEEFFTFDVAGESFTMPNRTLDVITTGFVRKNRRRDETDYVFTAVEELAGTGPDGERILAVIDRMNRDETKAFMEAFQAHLGASLGE